MLLFAFRQIEDLRYDLPEFFRVTLNGLLIASCPENLIKEFADSTVLRDLFIRSKRSWPFVPCQSCLPTGTSQRKINVASSCRGRGLVRRAKRKGFTTTIVGNLHRPVFGQKSSPVASVALTKNYALPVTNVGFREVSKQTRILDTFLIHPWPILIFHEPAPHSVEQLVKLVYRPLSGSKRLISDHLDNMTSDHRVAGSSPAGCNVLRDLCQESRSRSSKVQMT